MQYQYRPSGVCSRQITIDVENGVVQNENRRCHCAVGAYSLQWQANFLSRSAGTGTQKNTGRNCLTNCVFTRKNPLFVKILRAADFL